MGLFDRDKGRPEPQEQPTGWGPPAAVPPPPEGGWPEPQAQGKPSMGQRLQQMHENAGERQHYAATVNKGSRNMSALAAELNQRWASGWRLHTIFEKDGNTVCVYERRD